jgi:hypothetical protein
MEDRELWKFGVIEFHNDPKLRERFYHVVDDLRSAGCIVDLWINDIGVVLKEFGYEMRVYKPASPSQEPSCR